MCRPQLFVRHRERLDSDDLPPQLLEGHAIAWVEREEALEDPVGGMGDGQNGAEELGVVDVGAERLVGRTGLPPWVPAAGKVDEDDTEGPDVVLLGVVRLQALEEAALALGAQVERRTAATEINEADDGMRESTYQPKSVDVRSEVARPKSAMHIRSPSRVQRMFSGFRSR